LKIDWKKGEKYFAKKLVDYDVSSNNLNWQFSAQVGTDRQPYTRIYNPFIQNQKYDKECRYVKKWIPELVNVPCKAILRWYKYWEEYKEAGYPEPIVRLWG
jgi:deoxyribodipyrimidine photo-lyase